MEVTINVTRTAVKKIDPQKAIKNFDECVEGYTEEEALIEGNRCLLCRDAPCISACPAGINIPAFIAAMSDKRVDDAHAKIKEHNTLPSVCGRVCPSSSLCEQKCVLTSSGRPIAIRMLERYVGDHGVSQIGKLPKGKHKVAIVGSGPASLAAAEDLALQGYKVEVFEALDQFGGA